jgi:hypothetical protein
VSRFSLPSHPWRWGYYGPFAIAGSTVAWAEPQPPSIPPVRPRIVLAGTTPFRPRLFKTLPFPGTIKNIALSPHWLVWIVEPGLCRQWSLWAQRREGGQSFLIDALLPTPNGGCPRSGGGRLAAPAQAGGAGWYLFQPQIWLQGDELAWYRWDIQWHNKPAEPPSLHLINLQTRRRQTIATTTSCTSPDSASLTARYIIWVKDSGCHHATSSVLQILDLRTHHRQQRALSLPRSVDLGWQLVSDGRFAAWPNGRSDLVVLDLSTGRQTVVGHQVNTPPLFLRDSVLAWEGQYGGTIEAADLRTGRHWVLDPAFSYVSALMDLDAHHHLLWVQENVSDPGVPHKEHFLIADIP